MDNYIAKLYYGYQDTEDGIYHSFEVVDPDVDTDPNAIADKLADLLDTTRDDKRFGWGSMLVKIPGNVVDRIEADS